MKLTYKDVQEASKLNHNGVTFDSLATIFDVSPTTIRRYIRAFERYGKSFWGPFPTEVNDG
jgi:response regulator of citrate/malate metabolism